MLFVATVFLVGVVAIGAVAWMVIDGLKADRRLKQGEHWPNGEF